MQRAIHRIVRFAILIAPYLYGAESEYNNANVIATVDIPGLDESSGMAASRRNPGVYWSHNDSGGAAYIYAFDTEGRSKGRWRVTGAKNKDWEGMAAGPGPVSRRPYLYVGDIGDNDRVRRHVVVYRFEEPDVESAGREISAAEVLRFRYPDEPHDAEALLVHPRTGNLYIVTKARGDAGTIVYKATAPLRRGEVRELERVTAIALPPQPLLEMIVGRISGGDISPDGTRVILSDYTRGWEAVLPEGDDFDSIWRAEWRPVSLGTRPQGEAVCYRLDGRAVLATSEGSRFPLMEAERQE